MVPTLLGLLCFGRRVGHRDVQSAAFVVRSIAGRSSRVVRGRVDEVYPFL